VTTLLCLQLVAKTEDTRAVIERALAGEADVAPPGKPKRSGKRAASAPAIDDTVSELAAFAGLMFGLDRSSLRRYWGEVLHSSAGRDPAPIAVQPHQLLDLDGEAFHRALKHYVKSMVASGPVASHMMELLGNLLIDDHLPKADWAYDDLTLPPLEGIFEWEAKMEDLFDRSILVRDLVRRDYARHDYSGLSHVIEDPLANTITMPVILSYARWLAPEREHQPEPTTLMAMSYIPWQHYASPPTSEAGEDEP